MITKLRKAVEEMAQKEYTLAAGQHGAQFHSAHEAYAVMLEEVQECEEELKEVNCFLAQTWANARNDEKDITPLTLIHFRAINTACEAIQVAAMALKATKGYTE